MNLRHFALGTLAGASLLAACGDPQSLRASLATVQDTYTVYALTGTPAEYPSGINTYIRSAVRVDGSAVFDVAFDLDAEGRVLVYPVQRIVSLVGGNRRVGLRKNVTAGDSVTVAPTGEYPDSVVTAVQGDIIVVQSTRNGSGDACQFDISPFIYSRLTIANVTVATRTITVAAVVNPNCGFRSFEPGIPTR